MTTVLIIIFGFLLVGSIGGGIVFWRSRKLLREQKNYERGLKMVPLLIHLPPLSEDADYNGRDVRDLVDENVSKAQILYNIISSTVQKGFKSKFYGQRHFGFEIVATGGFVKFYAAIPMALLDVVQQAIVSAYPTARLEEVPEHNIFSPVGRISGTVGGELVLKEEYAYPIGTYLDIKRDAMQSMLNALSTLEKQDGAGIQFLMRPAHSEWRKNAQNVANSKRKGKQNKQGAELALSLGKDLVSAFVKSPEEKKDGKPEDKELSGTDQELIGAIEEKTRHPGYEVLIRVVASSDLMQRSQTVLNNIVASFALFDAPGKNGFKYVPARDIESFVTAYILRFFPQENTQNVLNSVELATLFHFPDQKNIPTSQLERQASKQVDGPRNMEEDGLLLGYNIFRGAKKKIYLTPNDRRRHMYIVGQTGTGKSTFLENLALQDMLNGDGFAFIDPHGDTAEKLLSMVPRERTEDVVYFCPADMDFPLGLNLFEFDNPEQKDFLIQEAINMLYKLYDPQHQGIIGPRYEHWFRNAALTLMSDPAGSTFIDIPKVFTDNKYAKQKLKHVTDQTVLDFWNKEMAQTSDYHKSEVLGWFVSKFGAFLSNEMMRNIIGQTKSSFNLREIMDNKKILLVNLSKGRTGELNSKLLGMIFVMKFQAAAMSRASIPEDQRTDFSLYVDEFQNFSTDSFATILSEARKYRLNLIVANQFTTQLTDEIRDAVFGNIGTMVAFRVGTDVDADALTKKFQPVFDRDDILRLPNYNTVTQVLVGGIPSQAFSMACLPRLGAPNKELGDALKQLSAAKHGRPKAAVEAEIFARLRTIEEPKPAFGTGPAAAGRLTPGAKPLGASAGPAGAAAPASPKTGSSFLDEWLTKRKSPSPPQLPPRPGAPAGQSSPRPAPPAAPHAAPSASMTPTVPVPPTTNQASASGAVHASAASPPASRHEPAHAQPGGIPTPPVQASGTPPGSSLVHEAAAPVPAPTPAPAPRNTPPAHAKTARRKKDRGARHADKSARNTPAQPHQPPKTQESARPHAKPEPALNHTEGTLHLRGGEEIEHHISLQSDKSAIPTANPTAERVDDTIFIDSDGNLVLNNKQD